MIGDGGDDAVHFVVKVVQMVGILQESENQRTDEFSIGGKKIVHLNLRTRSTCSTHP